MKPGPSSGDIGQLQVRLRDLSAPDSFVQWSGKFSDFTSCWNACPAADWMLWAAARTATTRGQRQKVVLATVAVARQAAHGRGHIDPRVTVAMDAAEAWARGMENTGLTLMAEHDAWCAADEAAAEASLLRRRAILLFNTAPRRRPASAVISRAISAQLAWRAARHTMLLACTAAQVARSATQASTAPESPPYWAACVGLAATYMVSAMSAHSGGQGRRAEIRASASCSRLIRQQFACPELG